MRTILHARNTKRVNLSVKQISNTYLRNSLIVLAYLLGLSLIIYRFLGDRFFDFGKTLMDRSGDGFKNYFAFAWQYKNEGGYWFDGMQYPYGDLLSFADGQPAITMLFVGLKKIGIDFTGHELFLVQGLPILGVFVAAYFLHRILRDYNVPVWWSMITVFACVALSPQVYRFNAHFTLAYMFCFPSIWYLLIQSNKEGRNKLLYSLLISFLLLVYGFIHPYHLLMGSVLLLGYFIAKALQKKLDWYALFSGLSPVVFYLLIGALIDPADDRIVNTWGAWYYKAELSDLFPFYGWYKEYLGDLFTARSKRWEGYAYVGALIFAVPYLIFRRKAIAGITQQRSPEIRSYLGAAILSLLFAMGTHISLTDHKILDWISALQQFRALGRFSWPFYYIGAVSLSVLFYRATITLKKKGVVIALFTFTTIMWVVDANAYLDIFHYKVQEYVSSNTLYTDTRIADALEGVDVSPDEFQAIMPLPVSMEGAEKIRPYRAYHPRMRGLPYAFQSGLPFIGAHMSRNSLSRILRQYQLGSSSYVEKEIVKDFKNRKDLLALLSHEDSLHFSDLAKKGIAIARTKHLGLYRMPIDSLEAIDFIDRSQLNRSVEPIFYANYIDHDGQGLVSDGYKLHKGAENLAKISVDSLSGETLRFSFWLRVDPDNSTTPAVNIRIMNSEGKQVKHLHFSDMDMKRCEVIGNWIQLKKDLVLPENSFELSWELSAKHLAIDHALITRVGEALYWNALDDDYLQYEHYIARFK